MEISVGGARVNSAEFCKSFMNDLGERARDPGESSVVRLPSVFALLGGLGASVCQSAIFLPMIWMQTNINASCLCALDVGNANICKAPKPHLLIIDAVLMPNSLACSRTCPDFPLICCSWVVPSGSSFHPCLCPTWLMWMSWGTTSGSCSTSLQGWPPSCWSSPLWVRRTGSQRGNRWEKYWGLFLHQLLCLSLQYFRINHPPLPRRRRPNTSCVRGVHSLLLCRGCCGTGPSCSWWSATVGCFHSPSAAPAAEQSMPMLLLGDSSAESCWWMAVSFTGWMAGCSETWTTAFTSPQPVYDRSSVHTQNM